MLLSVIVPLYNEEEIVEKTFRVLEDELKEIAEDDDCFIDICKYFIKLFKKYK